MWAGPLCTRVLADLGAEVIKIESPTRPDGTRRSPQLFDSLNRNKLGITLDLTTPISRDCFKELVRKCQVVVESFSPRVMVNFSLTYTTLRVVKPDLIMLSMPAYGSTGPYANYVAYGPGIEASSGLAALTGYSGCTPMLSGLAYADPVAGLHGAVAVLAALRYWRRFGKGQWIDLAQREAVSQMFGEAFMAAAKGVVEQGRGNRHPLAAPHGCFRCRGDDEWIAITIRSDAEWKRLCRVMNSELLGDDPRYVSMEARQDNEDQLTQEIESWTRQATREEAMRRLQSAGLEACMVMNARDLHRDPHLAKRDFFQRMVDPEGRSQVFPGLPWEMKITNGGVPRQAPLLGQHNRQILGGLLGMSDAEIEQAQGSVAALVPEKTAQCSKRARDLDMKRQRVSSDGTW
ncbi:MAG: CoA transferase [Chloroflexi bacterium]|nr:CoA transferase [Chloroflexota bacterium]